MKTNTLLSIILCFIISQVVRSNTIMDDFLIEKTDTWLVIDGKECDIDFSLNNRTLEYKKVGFILDLHFDKNREQFYHLSENGEHIECQEIFNTLISHTQTQDNRFVILFHIEEDLVPEFNKYILSLKERVLITNTRDSNQSLAKILSTDSLIFFSLDNRPLLDNSVFLFQRYFDIHHLPGSAKDYIYHPTGASASMIYGIFNEKNEDTNQLLSARRNYWQNMYHADWLASGLQPVFIVTNNQDKYFEQFSIIAYSAENLHFCNGVATINEVPLDYLYWIGEEVNFSYGYFNFQVLETKTYTPYRAGYKFTPHEITVQQGADSSKLFFEATPLALNEDLQLQLQFNDSIIKNETNTIKPKVKNCKVVKDKHRGTVLKVDKGGFIGLGTTIDNQIKDHSFSVAFWFKTATTLSGKHSIIGTNTRAIRQGLNIQVIYGTPHLGFFINELHSQYKITKAKWHHLAFSYDINCREKRIYIDGKLSDIKFESDSFIGNDSIYIGQCIGKETELPFYLDNLALWSRTLNEDEVLMLMDERTMFFPQKHYSYWYFLLPTVLMLLIALYFTLRKKPIYLAQNKTLSGSDKTLNNAILLLGDFSIYDKHGKNIVSTMSPLIKELFIKLLMAHIKGKHGESSQDLTHQFWNDLSTPKARNSRNVSLVRLRKYLDDVNGLKIEYVSNKHCIIADHSLFIDYPKAEEHAALLNKQDILTYFSLVKRGAFLQNVEYNWLESEKEEFNSKVISSLLNVMNNSRTLIDDDLAEGICKHLLMLDDLNEEALKHLLNLYSKQRKSTLVSKYFNEFIATYNKVYGSSFKYSLIEFLSAE